MVSQCDHKWKTEEVGHVDYGAYCVRCGAYGTLCPLCHGDGESWIDCPLCWSIDCEDCDRCEGEGGWDERCDRCDGNGVVPAD